MRRRPILLFALLMLAATWLSAQEPPEAPADLPDDGGPAIVTYAHSYVEGSWNRAGLNQRLSVHVQNFGKLLEKTNGNCAGIVLFLDGMPIQGLDPESCEPVEGHVRFFLRRTDQDADTWHSLLGRPHSFVRNISVSVGPSGQISIPTQVQSFELQVLPRHGFYLFILVLLGALVGFVLLCSRSDVIRSTTANPPAGEAKPYSLARFQMAFWFFLVVAAYIFVWLIADELNTITDSILGLIGIGAGTALGAALIDSKSADKLDPVALQSDIDTLQGQVAAATDDGTKAALVQQLAEKQQLFKTAQAAAIEAAQPSRGFFNDVLAGPDGVSFHRFQMFVWTLILGVIFLGSVYKDLSMPEFSATLLGLMGLSSGTYLGFKVPEKKAGG
jgi:hypothetical protein